MTPVGHGERLRIDVRKRLGNFDLVADLDLPLQGLTSIFGASGAGKSTLIDLVAGRHRPDSGRVSVGSTVFFDAADGTELPIERRALGYVFQDARLFPHLTVRGNLMFGYRRAGGRAAGAHVTPESVIDLLGLQALLSRRPHTLSGGEKQRVAIGRALLARPRLLLMDEPLASLDAARKSEVMPYIERLRDEVRVPILYVSHALDEVLRLATALVLLELGRVVAAGPLAEVLARPDAGEHLGSSEFGTLVFGVVRSHDERYEMSVLDCGGFELHVPRVRKPVGAGLRVRLPARDVALALAPPAEVSISNQIGGVIESVAATAGPYALVKVGVAGSVITSRITRESADRLALAPGVRVWCLIKSVALDADALAVAGGGAAMPASVSANGGWTSMPADSRR